MLSGDGDRQTQVPLMPAPSLKPVIEPNRNAPDRYLDTPTEIGNPGKCMFVNDVLQTHSQDFLF